MMRLLSSGTGGLLFVLVATSSGCAVDPFGTPDLNLLTFNLFDDENSWGARRAGVFQLIKDSHADVIGLQEDRTAMINQIRIAAPGYRFVGDTDAEMGWVNAILYNARRFVVGESGTFWLSDTPEVPGSRGWGNEMPRRCTWVRLADRVSGRAFYVFNVHLDPASDDVRIRSLDLILERISLRAYPDDPAILLGDLNAAEGSRTLSQLTAYHSRGGPGSVLVDAFRTVHPLATEAGTFHGFTGRRDGRRLDYIFVTPAWEVSDAGVVESQYAGQYPSDHFPVRARLRDAIAPDRAEIEAPPNQ